MYIRNCLTAVLAAMCITGTAHAQNDLAQALGEVGISGHFVAGVHQLDLGDLNSELRTAGYEEFDEDMLYLGGELHADISQLIIGIQGGALLTDDRSSSDGATGTELMGGIFMVNVGYDVFSSPRIALYPLVGIGVGTARMKFYPQRGMSFDDFLADPGRMGILNAYSALVDIGIGGEYMIVLGETDDGYGGMSLGFRAGYLLAPYRQNWKFERVSIGGGPKFDMTGPYVTITIGASGRLYCK